MSQAGSTSGGSAGPTVPTQFNTQSGNAIPAGNILIVNAYDTTENNTAGIETKGNTNGGNPPGTGSGNEVDVYLTNRFHGSATTTNATPTTIATCPMSTNPATFMFRVWVTAYDSTNNASFSTITTLTFRTTGGVPVLMTDQDFVTQQDTTFGGTLVDLNGSSTQLSVIVTGASATTIKWVCHGEYQMAS